MEIAINPLKLCDKRPVFLDLLGHNSVVYCPISIKYMCLCWGAEVIVLYKFHENRYISIGVVG